MARSDIGDFQRFLIHRFLWSLMSCFVLDGRQEQLEKRVLTPMYIIYMFVEIYLAAPPHIAVIDTCIAADHASLRNL
jgi:hypothetical protein